MTASCARRSYSAALEIACTVATDAVPQDEILRTGGRADWIGLYEREAIEGALQRGRREEAARDGERPQIPDLRALCAGVACASQQFDIVTHSHGDASPGVLEPYSG